jgi:hypothetical protein
VRRFYKEGEKVLIDVTFNKVVKVADGVPYLALNVANPAGAAFKSGDNSNTLTFEYTVLDGDNTTALDLVSNTALNLNGATIKDEAGNDLNPATLPYPALNSKIIVIDTIDPAVVDVTSDKPGGTFTVGENIKIHVNFNEPVQVDNTSGKPTLTIKTGHLGPDIKVLEYKSGTGTPVLTFEYVVENNDYADPLDYTSNTVLVLNGGSIGDMADNSANLTLPDTGTPESLAGQNITINTNQPGVVEVKTDMANNTTLKVGDSIQIDVVFSEPVNVTSPGPTLNLNTGASNTMVNCDPITEVTTMPCVYTVAGGDSNPKLDYVYDNSLS